MNKCYENLEAAIAASGLKKQTIAEKLGISHACLINKLSGRSRFYLDEAAVLLRILNLDQDDMSFYFNVEVQGE